jgi:ubiquitin carboxyl-terminal hydrolase 25
VTQRAEEVLALEPDRFEGFKIPTAVDVLNDLRSYLKHAFEQRESKPIKLENRRFPLRFGLDGQACKEVLDFLGFKHEPENAQWLPPQPKVDDSIPFKDSPNIFFDNALCELGILIALRPEDERRQIHDNANLPDAEKDLYRVLGAQAYDKHPAARTISLDHTRRDISYVALGVPQDASDAIVRFAYQQQIRTNPKESAMYLTYLRAIVSHRRSELLETLLATEISAGKFDAGQLNDAYRYFSLSPQDENLTDDYIIGNFRSRLEDSVKHEADMRAHLKIIGLHRQSRKIQDVASDGKLPNRAPPQSQSQLTSLTALRTYEQALAFFEAPPTLADEFFPSLYATKVSNLIAFSISRRPWLSTQSHLNSTKAQLTFGGLDR